MIKLKDDGRLSSFSGRESVGVQTASECSLFIRHQSGPSTCCCPIDKGSISEAVQGMTNEVLTKGHRPFGTHSVCRGGADSHVGRGRTN